MNEVVAEENISRKQTLRRISRGSSNKNLNNHTIPQIKIQKLTTKRSNTKNINNLDKYRVLLLDAVKVILFLIYVILFIKITTFKY